MLLSAHTKTHHVGVNGTTEREPGCTKRVCVTDSVITVSIWVSPLTDCKLTHLTVSSGLMSPVDLNKLLLEKQTKDSLNCSSSSTVHITQYIRDTWIINFWPCQPTRVLSSEWSLCLSDPVPTHKNTQHNHPFHWKYSFQIFTFDTNLPYHLLTMVNINLKNPEETGPGVTQ
jgi:hypothetical protein